MAFIDVQQRLSGTTSAGTVTSQHLTATADSTYSIDFGASASTSLSLGEPLAVVIEATALGVGVGTYSAAVVVSAAKDGGGTTVATGTIPASTPAGTRVVIPIPPQVANMNRWLRITYTLTGALDVYVVADLRPLSMIPNYVSTAAGYTIKD